MDNNFRKNIIDAALRCGGDTIGMNFLEKHFRDSRYNCKCTMDGDKYIIDNQGKYRSFTTIDQVIDFVTDMSIDVCESNYSLYRTKRESSLKDKWFFIGLSAGVASLSVCLLLWKAIF